MSERRIISIEQLQAELKAQGVERDHYAFVCPICSTVQSMALLRKHMGERADEAETFIGFSCVGRFSDAGEWRKDKTPDPAKPGCNWTLGGLLQLHKLEVVASASLGSQRCFELATPEQAQALKKEITGE